MEGERRRYRNYRPRAVEAKPAFPSMPLPPGLEVTPKQVAFLYHRCKLEIGEIAGRLGLKIGLVHLALYHYEQDKKAIDAELDDEREFNRSDSLKDSSMRLPRVDLGSLVDSMQFEIPAVELPEKTSPPTPSEVDHGSTTKRRGLGLGNRLMGVVSRVVASPIAGK